MKRKINALLALIIAVLTCTKRISVLLAPDFEALFPRPPISFECTSYGTEAPKGDSAW